MATPRSEPTLARLIRRSRALDTSSRRQWLALLPYLTDEDQDRLREILLASERRQVHEGRWPEPR